jgi:hypothetical protein
MLPPKFTRLRWKYKSGTSSTSYYTIELITYLKVLDYIPGDWDIIEKLNRILSKLDPLTAT